jgi:hypothetical protein
LSVKLVGRLPRVLAALEAGEVAWEHVQVILDAANPRIEDVLAGNEELVLDAARDAGHFGQFKAALQELAERRTPVERACANAAAERSSGNRVDLGDPVRGLGEWRTRRCRNHEGATP